MPRSKAKKGAPGEKSDTSHSKPVPKKEGPAPCLVYITGVEQLSEAEVRGAAREQGKVKSVTILDKDPDVAAVTFHDATGASNALSRLETIAGHPVTVTFRKGDGSVSSVLFSPGMDPMRGDADEVPELEDLCMVCCEPVSYYMIGSCNHREVCAVCMARLRGLYNDRGCPICKVELKNVVVTSSPHDRFEMFDLRSLLLDKIWHVHFKNQKDLERLTRLREVRCSECAFVSEGKASTSWGRLKDHTQAAHRLSFCNVCLGSRKVFPYEQRLYSPAELQAHMKHGDPDDPELFGKGHPTCHFCNKTVYGNDELYKHLRENHFQCTLCEVVRADFIYFESYQSLFAHFKQKHFVCSEPECVQQKYVVFKDQLDLQAHRAECHAGRRDVSGMLFGQQGPGRPQELPLNLMNSTTLQELPTAADFPSLEGQQHTPAPVALSTWHQASAASAGQAQFELESAFPSLSSAPAPPRAAPAASGWASRAGSQQQPAAAPAPSGYSAAQEDYPQLPRSAMRSTRQARPLSTAAPVGFANVVVPEVAEVQGRFVSRDDTQDPIMQGMMQGTGGGKKKKKDKKQHKPQPEDFPSLQQAPAWGAPAPSRAPAPAPARRAAPVMPSMPGETPAAAPPVIIPPESQEELVRRNSQLVVSMKGLAKKPSDFEQFKQASRQFQSGQSSPLQFKQDFFQAFGQSGKSRDVFTELIALLPNAIKREELLKTL